METILTKDLLGVLPNPGNLLPLERDSTTCTAKPDISPRTATSPLRHPSCGQHQILSPPVTCPLRIRIPDQPANKPTQVQLADKLWPLEEHAKISLLPKRHSVGNGTVHLIAAVANASVFDEHTIQQTSHVPAENSKSKLSTIRTASLSLPESARSNTSQVLLLITSTDSQSEIAVVHLPMA
jgi:hypothetical protein